MLLMLKFKLRKNLKIKLSYRPNNMERINVQGLLCLWISLNLKVYIIFIHFYLIYFYSFLFINYYLF